MQWILRRLGKWGRGRGGEFELYEHQTPSLEHETGAPQRVQKALRL